MTLKTRRKYKQKQYALLDMGQIYEETIRLNSLEKL